MRKRRRHTARRNPARRRYARRRPSTRHRARRNPPSFLGSGRSGIVGTIVQGGKDTAMIVGGIALTNYLGRLVPIPATASDKKKAAIGIAARLAAAIGIGIAARRVIGNERARMLIAGGLSVPVIATIKSLQISPEISAALASDEELGAYYDRLGSYVERLPSGAVNHNGVGDSSTMDPQYQHASGF